MRTSITMSPIGKQTTESANNEVEQTREKIETNGEEGIGKQQMEANSKRNRNRNEDRRNDRERERERERKYISRRHSPSLFPFCFKFVS
jgi:hypothetical protein